MTQTTQESIIQQQTEMQLWREYRVALAGEQKVWFAYHDAWRRHVTTGLRDDKTHDEWDRLSRAHDKCVEHRDRAYLAWKQAAYSLYNLGYLLKDEDEA